MTVPRDRHAAGLHYAVELRATPERVAQIRRIVAAHLRYWKLELHVEPVCEGIDALMANVHRHVGDANRCVVELRWAGRHLTASVEDNGPRMPRLLSAGGGGLARVAALSDSWGTCPTAGGKVIWFTRSVESPQDIFRVPRIPLTGIGTAELSRPAAPDPVPAGQRAPAVRPSAPALV